MLWWSGHRNMDFSMTDQPQWRESTTQHYECVCVLGGGGELKSHPKQNKTKQKKENNPPQKNPKKQQQKKKKKKKEAHDQQGQGSCFLNAVALVAPVWCRFHLCLRKNFHLLPVGVAKK